MNITEADSIAHEWLVHKGRFVNVTFMLKKADLEYLITIRQGRIVTLVPGPHVMPRWTFALVADGSTWQRFWSIEPLPRFHDLMAMVKFKTLKVEGDQAIFMSNLLYFKELIRQLGGQIHES